MKSYEVTHMHVTTQVGQKTPNRKPQKGYKKPVLIMMVLIHVYNELITPV